MKKWIITMIMLAAILIAACTTQTITNEGGAMIEKELGNIEEDSVEQGAAMEAKDDMMKEDSGPAMTAKDDQVGEDEMMEKDDTAMEDVETTKVSYSGKVLAGANSPYIDFNQADYDKALAAKKTVLLNFYANWCPKCIAEEPDAEGAFDSLDDSNFVGFRVSYKDSETSPEEVELAKKFGITYQHTKVIIDANGDVAVKSLETWESDEYISQLMTAK